MPAVEVRVQGLIRQQWSEWLEGYEIHYTEQGETVLTGSPVDQAALYGLLSKLRNLGLALVSVNPVGNGAGKGGVPGSLERMGKRY